MSDFNMNRRGFFGSVLGTIIATKLPFIAEDAGPIVLPDYVTQQELLLKFFNAPERIQRQYKLGLQLVGSTHIIGTPIETIKRTEGKVIIDLQDVKMTQDLTVEGLVFKTPNNQVITCPKYTYAQRVYPSDTLKNTYTVGLQV